MPGDETKNYDFVIEVNEQGCDKIIGAFFNKSFTLPDVSGDISTLVQASRLCQILRDLAKYVPGFPSISCEEEGEEEEGDTPKFSFVVNVMFDRPTDITLPPGAGDIVDIHMNLMTDGQSVGSLRMVAGLDVNYIPATEQIGFDIVRINLKDKLYHARVDISGLPNIPGVSEKLSELLRGLQEIPITPFPVNRNAVWPPASIYDSLPVSVDARIIDDVSQGNRNAAALLLTFAGDAPGNRDAFTRSFIPYSSEGAMALNFNWICKTIRPQLARALDTTESAFSPPCRLNRAIRIDGGVDLTALELTMVDDAIQVRGAVRKSGTGYSATGTLSATITGYVYQGRLVLFSHVDDPNIDVDLDWWVWLIIIVGLGAIGGAIGAVVGSIVGAIVGAVVGGIIGALLSWLSTEAIEGLLGNLMQQVMDAIKDLNLNVDLSAVGLDFKFLNLTLDDIIVGCDIDIKEEEMPHLSGDGYIRVNPNDMIDVANAIVGQDIVSGDIICELENGWRIRPLPHVVIARTDTTSFTDFNSYVLQGLQYERGTIISHSEMARTLPSHANLLGINRYQETGRVFAMRTRDGRYSLIQVAEMHDDSMTIRYRTYEKELPKAEIVGGLSYEASEFKGLTENILTRELIPKTKSIYVEAYGSQRQARPQSPYAVHPVQATPRPAGPAVIASPSMIPVGDVCGVMRSGPNRLPMCFGQRALQVRKAKFRARTYGLTPPVKVEWSIDDVRLNSKGGSVVTRGLQLYYTMAGDKITLLPGTRVNANFELAATVTDSAGKTTRACRYVDFVNAKTENVRLIRGWGIFREEFWNAFGDLQATG